MLVDGLRKRRSAGGRKATGAPLLRSAAHHGSAAHRGGGVLAASNEPRVLAMYDVSIDADGAKWQPAAGEPVRVDIALDDPVPVSSSSSLGVVHLADDGTVEELDPSRFGFTYNKDKSAVTAFWFSASGFSISCACAAAAAPTPW